MLIDEIKKARVQARKDRNTFRAGVLTTLLGEAEKVGKDAGNKKTDDVSCKRIIKKFIKNINETMSHTDRNSEALKNEVEILNEFLPDEMSENNIMASISQIILELRTENPDDKIVIGPVMKLFKSQNPDANFDGKAVSMIIRNQLS